MKNLGFSATTYGFQTHLYAKIVHIKLNFFTQMFPSTIELTSYWT